MSDPKSGVRSQPMSNFMPLTWPERSGWQNDDTTLHCPFCSLRFSFMQRRHHCRACGAICCDKCGDFALAHPKKENKLSRTCRNCYNRALTDKLDVELAPGSNELEYANVDREIAAEAQLLPPLTEKEFSCRLHEDIPGDLGLSNDFQVDTLP